MDTFAERVEAAAKQYFEQILPRHIERDLRGRGYVFLWRLLEAHDKDDLLSICHEPPPSRRATAMALRARAHCPIVIRAWSGKLLGQFIHHELYENLSNVAFRTLEESRHIEIYQGALEQFEGEELDHQLLLTIFHEYIHYFESFLEQHHQPLRGRERDLFVREYTLSQARWKDRLYTTKRLAFWGLLAAVVITLVAFVVGESWDGPGQPPPTAEYYSRQAEPEASEDAPDLLNEGRMSDDEN